MLDDSRWNAACSYRFRRINTIYFENIGLISLYTEVKSSICCVLFFPVVFRSVTDTTANTILKTVRTELAPFRQQIFHISTQAIDDNVVKRIGIFQSIRFYWKIWENTHVEYADTTRSEP